jgi:ABC-type Fe3+ transport system substrate-binding protein
MAFTMQAAVLKGANRPNAAKVFTNFMLSNEGQNAISAQGNTTIRKGAPVVFPALQVTKFFPNNPTGIKFELSTYREMVKVAKGIVAEMGK